MRKIKSIKAVWVVVAAAALGLSACSSGGSTPAGGGAKDKAGGADEMVSIALKTPTWIFPISAPGKTQGENGLFISNLYQNVYQYELGGTEKYQIHKDRSIGEIPEVSADNKTYTIKLKSRKWNDGTPITTKDVKFWWDLVTHNKDKWASYKEGFMPDNITKFEVIDDSTFKLTTDKEYSPSWFVDNQLGKIVPLPQHAWDPQNEATTEAGSKKVFETLTAAAKDTSSYAENKLWKTVSGPFTVDKYVPNGEVVLKRNDAYDGADKPSIAGIVYKPFTGDDAEFNVLRSGQIDYGYIPAGAISQKPVIEGKGYTVSPWYGWSITYMPFNFNNPKNGVVFKQKYIRQAMQNLIDQPTLSKVVWQDTAAPTCGPVPQKPGSGGSMEGCVYKFDPDNAQKLLKDHGWEVKDGVATCMKAGAGDGACGEGIAAGTKLSFKVTSQSGFSATSKMFEALKSTFAKAGIELTIQEVPDSVSVTPKCKPEEPNCDWDLSFFGSQSSWYFPVYASGERLFSSDGAVNLGSYNDPKADELINATVYSNDEQALKAYNDYLAEDLPVLWMPNPVAQTSAYRSYIKGIDPQDPTLAMYPQDWKIEK